MPAPLVQQLHYDGLWKEPPKRLVDFSSCIFAWVNNNKIISKPSAQHCQIPALLLGQDEQAIHKAYIHIIILERTNLYMCTSFLYNLHTVIIKIMVITFCKPLGSCLSAQGQSAWCDCGWELGAPADTGCPAGPASVAQLHWGVAHWRWNSWTVIFLVHNSVILNTLQYQVMFIIRHHKYWQVKRTQVASATAQLLVWLQLSGLQGGTCGTCGACGTYM